MAVGTVFGATLRLGILPAFFWAEISMEIFLAVDDRKQSVSQLELST